MLSSIGNTNFDTSLATIRFNIGYQIVWGFIKADSLYQFTSLSLEPVDSINQVRSKFTFGAN
jgi:hypothetical protein